MRRPVETHDGELVGSLCVLDTRPRQITEQQKEMLTSVANAVMTAIELHGHQECGQQDKSSMALHVPVVDTAAEIELNRPQSS